MTFLSEWLMTLMYGEAYRAAGQVLMIHIWAGVFVFMGVGSSKWYISEGLHKYLTINTVAGAILNIVLNVFLIPKYGIYGAALATVMSQALASYVMSLMFQRTRPNFVQLTRSVFWI
jgi:O-antigen/teichoic acid export membrane protein